MNGLEIIGMIAVMYVAIAVVITIAEEVKEAKGIKDKVATLIVAVIIFLAIAGLYLIIKAILLK